MQSDSNYPSVANHLRRIIPAYILSPYLPFLQIWLGIEFSHFSKELTRAGEAKPEDGALTKIAKYFTAAGVLTIFTFVCWLIPYILPYLLPYLHPISFTFSYYGTFEVDLASILKYASIGLPAIMGLIQTALLLKAWKQIRVYFSNKEQQKSLRTGGVDAAGKVVWAMELSGFGYGLIGSGFVVMYIVYLMNMVSTSLAPTLAGLGELLTFIGLINICVGMGQAARAFQNLTGKIPSFQSPYIQPQYQRSQPQYAAQPVAYAPAPVSPQIKAPAQKTPEAPKPRFCSGCGAELPNVAGLKFCPTCGSSLTR